MTLIMRRESMIFFLENHRIDNAVRRCLSDETKWFYQILVSELAENSRGQMQQSTPSFAWRTTGRNREEAILPGSSLSYVL